MKRVYFRTTMLGLALLALSVSELTSQKLNMDQMQGLKPRNIGPAGMSGRVTSIDVLLRDPSTMYFGSAAGGLWKTENGGDTWKALFTDQVVASIGAVTINQNNPLEIWVGTGEGNPRNSQNSGYGIYRSRDGGRSWQLMGLEQTRTIHRIIMHRDDPNTLVVAATGSPWGDSPHRGIYKTTDGGKTWQKTLYVNQRTGASDLVVDPHNPNKMYAGMWEYRRWPWYFKSGGAGSGLYVSHDGGDTWELRNHQHGLPEGEIGRIGLSVAPSQTNVVYAYVESKSNAIYRSDDGGFTWKRRSKEGDRKIGDRPFYYADIYVDTQNENRIYSIATEVNISEDGGKTWNTYVPGNRVHTDHHAWWSHPQDHNFIILGHDGGANITYDRGKNWRFFDNLPLAQFYHVRVDNEFPYNVYGGLQDNGSWKGPSQVWFKGGIRNMYWQRLSVGDGFDMIPDPENTEYGWSMGQQGNLFRYHTVSGQLKRVKPQHPDGVPLRFNWNAGIAIDPFDPKIVYYGSQFLLKSEDEGGSWQVISGDLTTNDPEKQQQLTTGGLTYDNTGAENHTTIISVVPSTLKQGLMWVGTDDGLVHITRDGGQSWSNVGSNIKGVPANTWVPHIHVSNHQEGEAFVVFEDHRRDNWIPYVYHTQDFGKSWRRIVDANDVWGFVYTFVQDPWVPNLYFCGTESGLYVSLDAGANWQKWTNGYPTVPTMDMVIHPREGDLVLGTFGRAFWVLDDLTPLREMATDPSIANKQLHQFKPQAAYLVNIGESFGYRQGKIGDALFEGENRPYGALINYYLGAVKDEKSDAALQDSVQIIISQGGTTIRNLYQTPKVGVNRINWQLDHNALRYPNQDKPDKAKPIRGGTDVVPGEYQVLVVYKGDSASHQVEVKPDPRLNLTANQMAEKGRYIMQHATLVNKATEVVDVLNELRSNIKTINKKLDVDHEAVEQGKAISDSIEQVLRTVFPAKDTQGIYRDPSLVQNKLQWAAYTMSGPLVPWTQNQALALQQAELGVKQLVERANELLTTMWEPYRNTLSAEEPLLLPKMLPISSSD